MYCVITMKYKKESNFDQSRGKLLYKSKTPINPIPIIAIVLLDILLIFFLFESLFLLIDSLISLDFPESIFPFILSIVGMAFSGFISYIFTHVIVRKFLTFLFIYENGIEIRKTSLFPLKFKKFYISNDQITNVEITEVQTKNGRYHRRILNVHQTDGSVIRLLNTEVKDLEEAKNLILKEFHLNLGESFRI